MKNILSYINESRQSEYTFFCEQFTKLFKGITFNVEYIKMMLKNLELNVLKQLSDYYNNIDVKNYIAYQPNDDLFQSTDNIDKITTQMAEYISKNCCN